MTYYRPVVRVFEAIALNTPWQKMRKVACAAGLVLLTSPATAGVREDVLAAMQRCSSIPDDRVWLDCTYGAQQLMRAKLGLQPAPEFQQRLVPPAPAISTAAPVVASSAPGTGMSSPRGRGGVMQLFSGTSRAVAVSVLVAVRYDNQGGFIATLQNGQVWHQVNLRTGDKKARLTLGSKVTILPGAMWSYDLKTEDSPHLYKVNRDS